MIKLCFYILFLNSILGYYISTFNIKFNNNLRDTASNLLDLNYVLSKKTPANNINTYEYNYNGKKSLCYTYETFSNFDDYTYKNKLLFISPYHYLATYTFKYDNYDYNYLLFINATKETNTLISWDIKLKYNYRFPETIKLNEDMVKKWIIRCINKKSVVTDKKLINFFK